MSGKSFLIYQWKKMQVCVFVVGIALLVGLYKLFMMPEQFSCAKLPGSREWIFHLSYLGNVSDGVKFFRPAAWIVSAVLAFLLFNEYGDSARMDYLRSLPYTRKGMWGRSYLLGIVTTAFCYLIFALAAGILYAGYWREAHNAYLYCSAYEVLCSLDSLGNALMYILEEWVITLGIFSAAVFARMAMSHLIAALFTFAGALTIPAMLLESGSRLLRWGDIPGGKGVAVKWADLADRLLVLTAHLDREMEFQLPQFKGNNILYSDSVRLEYCTYERSTMLIWAGITVTALIFSYRMVGRETAFSVIGRTPLMENLFIFFAGLFLALLMAVGVPGHMGINLGVMLTVFFVTEGSMIYLFKKRGQGKYEKWNTWKGGADEEG